MCLYLFYMLMCYAAFWDACLWKVLLKKHIIINIPENLFYFCGTYMCGLGPKSKSTSNKKSKDTIFFTLFPRGVSGICCG